MKTALIIMFGLSIFGIIIPLLTGLWLCNHDSLLVDLSNSFNIHRFQTMKSVISSIITLVLVIMREMYRS